MTSDLTNNAPEFARIVIVRGQSYKLKCIFRDTNGALINTTGWTFEGEAREYPDKKAPLVTTLPLTHPIPASGEVFLDILKTVSINYREGNFFFDLWCTDSLGSRYCFLNGEFNVTTRVTV